MYKRKRVKPKVVFSLLRFYLALCLMSWHELACMRKSRKALQHSKACSQRKACNRKGRCFSVRA